MGNNAVRLKNTKKTIEPFTDKNKKKGEINEVKEEANRDYGRHCTIVRIIVTECTEIERKLVIKQAEKKTVNILDDLSFKRVFIRFKSKALLRRPRGWAMHTIRAAGQRIISFPIV